MTTRFVLTCALLLAGPATAQTYAPPAGCTAYLTVQSRDCTVEQHFTCEAHPGDRWRVDFNEDGPFYESRIDAEAQWVTSTHLLSGQSEVTVQPMFDPASISTLLDTGSDSYAFDIDLGGGRQVRVEGWDRLTGDSIDIGGEPLLRTEYIFRMKGPNGAVLLESRGQEFVSASLRRFFAGERTTTTAEGTSTRDGSPVSFHRPGQPGFGDTTPRHGCGEMMSALPSTEGRG